MKAKKLTLEINNKDYEVIITEFGAETARLTVNGTTYTVGIKDLGIEQVSDIKPQPIVRRSFDDLPAPPPSVPVSNGGLAPPLPPAPKYKVPQSVKDAAAIKAPLPGLILKIPVAVGDEVKAGQDVLHMEAMKMENEVQSNVDGRIREIRVKEGDSVSEGDILIVLE
jgi:glutaconyl-CoA/methylmalonyl-CoA decarboxylase subunit gamma